VSAWLMAAALPCYLALALPSDIDQDILNVRYFILPYPTIPSLGSSIRY